MDKLLQFFDFAQPCPSEIVNCEEILKMYALEAERLKATPGCWGCKEKGLKSKYMAQLQGHIKP